MKIAVVSDIHGNINAFNRCLKYIEEQSVDMILNLGDFVRGENQDEILELIMEDNRFQSIKGNHEEEYCKECNLGKNTADANVLKWISNQQHEKIIEVNGFKMLMVHSRTCSNKLPPLIYSGGNMNEFMDDYPNDVDLICLGHTHIQLFMENFYGKRIINPGSVGLAIDGKVNFAVIELDESGMKYSFVKLEI